MSVVHQILLTLQRGWQAVAQRLGGRSRRWAQILDSLNPQMFVGLLDAQGRILEGNSPALVAVGARREDLIGTYFWESPFFQHSQLMAQQIHEAVRRAASGQPVRQDIEIRLVDGRIRTLDLSIQVERDRRGTICYLVPSAFDVTEARSARNVLDEHLRVHRFHLDNTPLVVIEWDADLRVREWPERAERMFGWTAAEAVGRTCQELGLLADSELSNRERWLHEIESAGTQLPTVLSRCRRRDGQEIMVESYRSVQRDEAGRMRSLFTFSQDVTAREQALREVRNSEERFRGVFNQASVGVALLDAQGRWLKVNRPLCQLTGYSEDELLKLDFQTITHPEDLDKDLEQARKLINGESAGYQMEKRYLRKDGTVVWILLHVGRIDATSESPAYFVSVVEDISERKAAEARMRTLSSSLERQVGERTLQLRKAITDSEQRNVELAQVAEITGLLAGARDVEEALRIVGRSFRTLFPLAEAALYLATETPERLHLQDWWGQGARPESTLYADHCWGLRRGKEHRVEDAADPLRCPHHGESADGLAHSCLPLMALGDRLGLLSLSWRANLGWAPAPLLLRSLAEQIGLAIGNVRLREELRRQAQHDPLTGLLNRRQLDEHLRQRNAEQARTGRGYSLLLLDLDFFKSINDRFGHEAGDRVLQEAAALFRRCARTEEAVFRLGGEEFVMVLATDDPGEAQRGAERIRGEMQAMRVSRRGQILPAVTVSIGIACFPTDASDATALLHAADEALYAAKRGGRNRCQRHDLLKAPVLAQGAGA